MDYVSPIRGGAGRLQQISLRLLRLDDPIGVGINLLEQRRNYVGNLFMFYIYLFLKPSIELGSILPPA